MITRRVFIGSSISAGLLASAPALARAMPHMPLVVHPALFENSAPAHAITQTGHDLLTRLFPFEQDWSALAGFTDSADATMLKELVRVRPGATWHYVTLPVGSGTALGRTLRPAIQFEARWS